MSEQQQQQDPPEKLESFEAVYKRWQSSSCDRSCSNGSVECACTYWWRCPHCGAAVSETGQNMEFASDVTDGQCEICYAGDPSAAETNDDAIAEGAGANVDLRSDQSKR